MKWILPFLVPLSLWAKVDLVSLFESDYVNSSSLFVQNKKEIKLERIAAEVQLNIDGAKNAYLTKGCQLDAKKRETEACKQEDRKKSNNIEMLQSLRKARERKDACVFNSTEDFTLPAQSTISVLQKPSMNGSNVFSFSAAGGGKTFELVCPEGLSAHVLKYIMRSQLNLWTKNSESMPSVNPKRDPEVYKENRK